MFNLNQTIIIQTELDALHKYVNAPKEVEYLKNIHRHLFKICVEMEVFHDDRELEFIIVKHDLNEWLNNKYQMKEVASCEQIANDICDYLTQSYGATRRVICTVLEDGENGGKVYYGF